MNRDCQEVRDLLSGYVDEELAPNRRGEISTHLENCPACNTQAQAQRAVKTLLHDHSPHDAAPHHLRARIMHSLRTQPKRLSFASLLRQLFELQPLPAFASIALLIAIISGISMWSGGTLPNELSHRDTPNLVMNGQIEGVFTCVDCELLDVSKTPYTHDQSHRLAVRCDDGIFWNILQTSKGVELSSVSGLMQRRVRIKGHVFPEQHLVDVTEYTVI